MTNIDKIIDQVKILLTETKFEKAEILLKKIIEIDPTHYKAHINIGVIHSKLNKLKDAEKYFVKAIELKPDYELAYFNLGTTQNKLGKTKEAENSFKKAIEINSNYVEAYSNLGHLYLETDNLNSAEAYLNKAINLRPNFSEAHYNLGLTQSKKLRYDLAELSYKKAIEFKPNFIDAIHNLKKILRQNKLLFNIQKNKNKFIDNSTIETSLSKDPYIFKRKVEPELISELYKIETNELDNTKDVRYGNGVCSDYELFENNSKILKNVEKDLIEIMSQAVNSDIFIIESFFNILKTSSGLASHNHINDFDEIKNLTNKKYSLTYYLSVGDQESSEPGILKIYDPILEILPSPGTIIIFPSSRQHSVFYNGKTDRVMIGINFYALG
ncbi:tetratricopeptide repeat protein [Candidatus Pelagibacter sp.]|nr:tetratricopeptide repeat protein [Candidatus Pelagibacter sp.]